MRCACIPVKGWSGSSSDTIFDMANTKAIGEISEAIVLAEFLKMGFPVLLPFGDNQRYDMVIEAGGRFLRGRTPLRQAEHPSQDHLNGSACPPRAPIRHRLRSLRDP